MRKAPKTPQSPAPRPRARLVGMQMAKLIVALTDHASPAPTAPKIRRYHDKHRKLASLVALHGPADARKYMDEAGFSPSARVGPTLHQIRDLVDEERDRLAVSRQMELDEALRVLAEVARDSSDRKTQLGAIRTVLEVHGALGAKPLPPTERAGLVKQIEEMVEKLKSGGTVKTKIRMRTAAEIEVSDGVDAAPEAAKTLTTTVQNGGDFDVRIVGEPQGEAPEPLQEPYKSGS